MVEIYLTNKGEDEHKYKYNLNISSLLYANNFEKILYKISYKETFEQWNSSWFSTYYTYYIYIINNGKTVFTYKANVATHEVKEVEAYFSNAHKNVPLIIGFKRDDPGKFTYFTYSFLKNEKSSYGFPSNNQFFESDLQQKLENEDDRVNRVKFTYENKDQFQNYDEKTEDIDGKFTKHCFTVLEAKRYDDHILSTKRIFQQEKNNEIDGTFFNSLNAKYFDKICVYYTNPSNIALLVQFINGDTKTYFTRQDCYGYYWVSEQINQINDDQLTKIHTASDSKLSYLIGRKEKYKGVTVTDLKDTTSFDKFKHTPKSSEITPGENNSHTKIALLLYNNRKIIIQPNYDLKTDNNLDTLENKKISEVTVYYELNVSKSGTPPLIIQLVAKSNEGTDTVQQSSSGSTKTYWLKRLDNEGFHWSQFNEKNDDVTQKKQEILTELKHSSNTSIVVQMDQKSPYSMNLIHNYIKDGMGLRTDPIKQIQVDEKYTLGLNYKFYEHDLSGSSTVSESKNIVSIRCYFKDYEVKFQTTSNKTSKFDYNPITDASKIVYTYFYSGDNLALMLSYDGKFYRPKNLSDYFTWEQVSGISNTNDTENIKRQLNEINKEFNTIQLEITTNNEKYGKITYKDLSNNELGNPRITVTNETPSSLFKMAKHATTNTGPIGKIICSNSQLLVFKEQQDTGNDNPMIKAIEEESGSSSTTTIYNTVCAYYHLSDSGFNTPLLLGISKGSTNNPNLFYQRIDNNQNSKWKRTTGIESRKLTNDAELSQKINQIHYNFTSSIMIQLENQGHSGINNYDLKLVKNIGTDMSKRPDRNSKITSNKCDCLTNTLYTCYKHSITLGTTNASDIGGLRLFLGTWELKTFTTNSSTQKSIFYQQAKNDIYVYFHKEAPLPLLVSYEKKYYGPTSRDDYFGKWEEKTGIGDNTTQKLNVINQFLNDIELAETTNSNTGKKYGIVYPGKDPPQELNEDFYGRVFVKPCITTNYRKLTHSTINKFGIGSILFHGKPVSGIQVQFNENEVFVYYDVNDIYFSRPLMLSLGSQTQQGQKTAKPVLPELKKWYKRTDLTGTRWTLDEESHGPKSYYRAFLKDKLQNIFYELFTVLEVEIQQLYSYNKQVAIKRTNEHTSELKVTNLTDCGGFEIKEYKCYEHQIYEYYNAITTVAADKQELNFILEPSISGIKLGLYNQNKVAPLLTYGSGDSTQKRKLFVYFAKSIDGDDDIIPLAFNYNGTFFGPSSKDQYFHRWINLNIDTVIRGTDGPRPEDKVKENLIQIYYMVNAIDLCQTSSYGLKCCSKHQYYNKPKGFTGKRFTVTSYTNRTHKMYVHQTVYKTKIGQITHTNSEYKFNQHSQLLTKHTIDEVAVVFTTTNTDKPILVLLNKSSKYGYSSYTYGYYYQNYVRGDHTTEYNFHQLSGGYNVMNILKGDSQDAILGVEQDDIINNIQHILNDFRKNKMVKELLSDPDNDTTDCKAPVDIEEQLEECHEDDLCQDTTDAVSENGLKNSTEHQDDRPKAGSPSVHGLGDDLIGPGGRSSGTPNDQAGMAAGSKVTQHPAGSRGPSPHQEASLPRTHVDSSSYSLETSSTSSHEGQHTNNGSASLEHHQESEVQEQHVEQQQESQVPEIHVKQQQQESQVPEVRGHSSGHSAHQKPVENGHTRESGRAEPGSPTSKNGETPAAVGPGPEGPPDPTGLPGQILSQDSSSARMELGTPTSGRGNNVPESQQLLFSGGNSGSLGQITHQQREDVTHVENSSNGLSHSGQSISTKTSQEQPVSEGGGATSLQGEPGLSGGDPSSATQGSPVNDGQPGLSQQNTLLTQTEHSPSSPTPPTTSPTNGPSDQHQQSFGVSGDLGRDQSDLVSSPPQTGGLPPETSMPVDGREEKPQAAEVHVDSSGGMGGHEGSLVTGTKDSSRNQDEGQHSLPKVTQDLSLGTGTDNSHVSGTSDISSLPGSSNSQTHQGTTGVEGPKGNLAPGAGTSHSDTESQPDLVSKGTGLTPGAPRKPGINGQRQPGSDTPSGSPVDTEKKNDEVSSPEGNTVETGRSGDSSSGSTGNNQKPPKYTGDESVDKIIDEIVTYCKKNPAVVGGASSAVTVASSSYPFYKLILKCIRKK